VSRQETGDVWTLTHREDEVAEKAAYCIGRLGLCPFVSSFRKPLYPDHGETQCGAYSFWPCRRGVFCTDRKNRGREHCPV
jgi:hypothetical protein